MPMEVIHGEPADGLTFPDVVACPCCGAPPPLRCWYSPEGDLQLMDCLDGCCQFAVCGARVFPLLEIVGSDDEEDAP